MDKAYRAMGFLLAILGALLAIGAVIALFMYFVAVAAVWMVGLTAVILALFFTSFIDNSTVSLALTVITTLLIWGLIGHFSDKN